MHDRVHHRLDRRRPLARRRTGRPSGIAIAGGIIAALAASALWNGRQTRLAIRCNPPRGRFVEVDGVNIHYTDHGGGAGGDEAPVVLIHGNGSMLQDFELSGVVDRLLPRHRVVVFDRPGAGFSERPDDGKAWTPQRQAAVLVAAADKIGLIRPIVVGHSWGTLVALAWALDHADRISALVLASGYYFPGTRLDVIASLPGASPATGGLMCHTISPLIGRASVPLVTRMIFAPAAPTRSFVAHFPFALALRPLQLKATYADTAQMVAAATLLKQRYDALRLPLALIAGDGDRIVDFTWHTKQLAGRIPHARLFVVKGAGHMVHHTAPDDFVAAVEAVAGTVAVRAI